MTELQKALFTYLLESGYIPTEIAREAEPLETLASAVEVLTDQAHDATDPRDNPALLALARACDIAVFGPTKNLAQAWATGNLESGPKYERLADRVRLAMDLLDSDSDDAKLKVVTELVGSDQPWVRKLIERVEGAL